MLFNDFGVCFVNFHTKSSNFISVRFFPLHSFFPSFFHLSFQPITFTISIESRSSIYRKHWISKSFYSRIHHLSGDFYFIFSAFSFLHHIALFFVSDFPFSLFVDRNLQVYAFYSLEQHRLRVFLNFGHHSNGACVVCAIHLIEFNVGCSYYAFSMFSFAFSASLFFFVEVKV